MDIEERNQRIKRGKKVWFGPNQKKILLLLLGGLALSCTRSPKKQWKIVKGIHEDWNELSRQAAERAVTALYASCLLEAKEHTDGTVTLVLNENGKKRALTYHMRYAKVVGKGPWDKKWRIILYDIPEDEREARDAFRDHLKQLGVRKLQHSAGIYPFDCKDEVYFFIELLDIRKYVRFIVAESIDDEAYWKHRFRLSVEK